MGDQELIGMLDETKDEFLNLKFQNATGQLDNSNLLMQTRRQVARIHTELRIREIQEAERTFADGGATSSERTADAEGDDRPGELDETQPAIESKPLKKKRKGRNRSDA